MVGPAPSNHFLLVLGPGDGSEEGDPGLDGDTQLTLRFLQRLLPPLVEDRALGNMSGPARWVNNQTGLELIKLQYTVRLRRLLLNVLDQNREKPIRMRLTPSHVKSQMFL
jgi:hypothetical protein